ncbi:uncharacterized protein TNCV_2267971 [Trichonephila clavipes]|nr:uncharacterized protein TNCV_2267971 [Trichonephila clavipes]
MSKNSPFVIHRVIICIGGEPKSIKRLRSGDLLIETNFAIQTNSFLLAKSFLDSPVNISPHKSLNTSRGVISESDLLTTTEADVLEGFSDQGVIQVRKTETRSFTTPNKFAALSTETQPLVPLPESVPTTSNSEHSDAPEIPQCLKRNSRNRRKRPKGQKLK